MNWNKHIIGSLMASIISLILAMTLLSNRPSQKEKMIRNLSSYNLNKLRKTPGSPFFQERYPIDNAQARENYNYNRLIDPNTGDIPSQIKEKEMAFALSKVSSQQPLTFGVGGIPFAPGEQTSNWVNRGPFNVGGRTRALAIDMANESRILAGGVSGGMWLSQDGGTTWSKTTGSNELQSVTAIAQDPIITSTWYYTTGENTGNSAGGSGAFFVGDGVYKSTDNGASWTKLPNPSGEGSPESLNLFDLIHGIVVDPTNSDVYVAGFGSIRRSTDGTNFNIVLDGNAGNTGESFTDIVVTSTGVFYATLESTTDMPGIWRSPDGSMGNWTDITPVGFPNSFNRTVIAIDPSDVNLVYFLSETPGSNPLGHDFWKYTDDGMGTGTWEDRSDNLPDFGGSVGDLDSQGGYDLLLKVHPAQPNTIFVCGTNIYRSTDGFSTKNNTDWIGGYSPVNNVSLYTNHHPDQHSMVFYPSDADKVLSGHDGGISMTNDIRASSGATEQVIWTSLNNGYLTTQVYALSIGPDDQLMAGFQDNSTFFTNNNSSTNPWSNQLSGDGAYNAFNNDGTLRYVSAQSGFVFRLEYPDADSETAIGGDEITPSGSSGYLFIPPFELDPNDDQRMYLAAGTSIWRNDDLPNATTTNGWTELPNLSGSAISALAVSTNPPDILYIGTTSGEIYKLEDPHTSSPDITDIFSGQGLPGGNVSSVDVDPFNFNDILVGFSNYSIPSVFHSIDGGASWTDVSGDLEENPNGSGSGPSVRWVTRVGNNDRYFAGTSTGLYSTNTLSGTSTVWTQEDPTQIGNVVVDQVRAREDGLVVIGTHGNGLYSAQFEISQPGVIVINLIDDVLAKVNNQDIDLNNVFQSTKSPALPLTFSTYTDNPTLLTPTVGNVLTLAFTEDQEGEATVNVAAQDTEMAAAFTSFKVTVEFVNDKFPYVKSFESGPNEWVAGGISSSWELGEPNNTLIDQASKGTQAWVTNLNGSYNLNEQSFVESPKFDLSSLNKPKIIMDIWWQTEDGFDGAALQSSIDEGQTWNHIGSIGDKTNWYTGEAEALGFSGNTEGWEGQNGNGSGGWIRAKHLLRSLKGETRVKFRIVFGSDILVQDEGFAFDNVQILDDLIAPTDLLDNPTASNIKLSWADNSNNEKGFDIERSKDDDQNFKLLTTVDKDQTSFKDKKVTKDFVYFYRVAAVNNQGMSEYSNVVNTSLIPLSPSSLVIDATPGDVTLSWLDNSNNENEFIVERSLTDNQNFVEIGRVGEDITSLTDEDLDGVSEFFYRVAAANVWGQSDFSDEMLVITVGFEDELSEELQIYPNPTNGRLKIIWGKSLPVNGQILIRDVSGMVVVNAERLVQNQILDLSQLQSGVYLVEFIADNKILTIRKVVKQ